ncbi:gliding motility-associated C-terminal domain-containing protein [Pedobacter heparinus]|uniref:gliding motility-associated C-terminal domain-containing protein n=1 Tax=Pedobacter heparinus TaxID=984 RepID=UPI00292D1D4F|nr:gliding motility-associated C-terminal domain-containing protein [Pedobacter heparinus]
MLLKLRSFLVFILLCQSYLAFSEDITVNSNADSGTGTLRAALLRAAANGTAEKDHIYFNLPGNTEAEHSIILAAELPRISSNIVIDATSQPGPALGISTAKIAIRPDRSIYRPRYFITAAFYLSQVSEVEIYGFYFTDFFNIGNSGTNSSGIFAIASKNITIGAIGKGNVFTNSEYGIQMSNNDSQLSGRPPCENVKIQSNWTGLMPDGSNYIAIGFNPVGMQISADACVIGGNTRAEGNTFGGFLYYGIRMGGKQLVFQHNKLGFDGNNNISIRNIVVQADGDGLVFKDNIASVFQVQFNNLKNFAVTGNENLLDNGSASNTFNLTDCENGVFGTDVDEDKNILRYSGISSSNGKNIEIRKNSIYCTYPVYSVNQSDVPVIEILVNTDTEYSGTATPGSEVYIYNDNTDCDVCSPVEFYTKITAGPAGDWKITGDFSNNRFISNCTLIKSSSVYTQPQVLSDGSGIKHTVTNPSCGLNNGTIKLLNLRNVLKVEWFNVLDEKVGEGAEVNNLPGGRFYAKVYNGKCFVRYNDVYLENSSFTVIDQDLKVTQPTCGLPNGAIRGLIVTSSTGHLPDLKWLDKNNRLVRAGNPNLSGIGPGEYTLVVSDALGCNFSYGPLILSNQTGPAIDQSAVAVQGSPCNAAIGSIKNIRVTGTGTLTYKWTDAAGNTAGLAEELTAVPAGLYQLEVKDESGCPALVSAPIPVNEINGISIDHTGKVIGKATCNTSDGSITGILVTGATRYEWLDAGNNVVSTSPDLRGMPAGKYRLVASSAVCVKTSEEFTIEIAESGLNYNSTKITTNATCGLKNGKIEVIFTDDQPTACFWKNSTGDIVGDSRILEDQGPGAYDLYIIDNLGCTHFAQQYSISNTEGAMVIRIEEQITNDKCGLGTGQIKAPGLSRGQLPYFYEWKDKNGQIIGSKAVLDRLKAGVYQLIIGDALACSRQVISYTVESDNVDIAVPILNDVKVCSPGNVLIQVMQAEEGVYAIYNQAGSLIETNSTGVFNFEIEQAQAFTVVLQRGDCQSLAATVRVSIENEGIGKLANALSPNGDGVNEEWLIPGIANYPGAKVEIYNRYGHKVFESTGYKTPFTGRWKGNELPVGTYYYIIDLKRACGLLKGSLTIVR